MLNLMLSIYLFLYNTILKRSTLSLELCRYSNELERFSRGSGSLLPVVAVFQCDRFDIIYETWFKIARFLFK